MQATWMTSWRSSLVTSDEDDVVEVDSRCKQRGETVTLGAGDGYVNASDVAVVGLDATRRVEVCSGCGRRRIRRVVQDACGGRAVDVQVSALDASDVMYIGSCRRQAKDVQRTCRCQL